MDTVQQILAKYEVETLKIDQPQAGYRNSSYRVQTATGDLNLIIFKSSHDTLKQIKTANQLGLYLHAAGLPVRYPIDERILQVRGGANPTYAGLYNYLPGNTIPWEAYTRKHIKALGRMLYRLHHELAQARTDNMPRFVDVGRTYIGFMREYFTTTNVVRAMSQKLSVEVALSHLDTFERLLTQLNQSDHVQLLHLDFVRGNVLFADNAAITGVIDFEKAAIGHPLIDVARTLAFLRVDCKYKTKEDVARHFIEQGYYHRHTPLTPRIFTDDRDQTHAVLEQLVNFFMLYDFYKFLLHNPYESLSANEHFVRTKDQLVANRLLK